MTCSMYGSYRSSSTKSWESSASPASISSADSPWLEYGTSHGLPLLLLRLALIAWFLEAACARLLLPGHPFSTIFPGILEPDERLARAYLSIVTSLCSHVVAHKTSSNFALSDPDEI